MTWLGLDIGGANLKAADEHGLAASVAFPLWKQPGQLRVALESLIRRFPHATGLAVTMTGELADCFATKRDGVAHILTAVAEGAQSCGDLPIAIYLTDGNFVSAETAHKRPWEAAASNWHALARFAWRLVPADTHSALLIDIGSTTTDIIPLIDGQPATRGKTDTDRLLAGELVYTGVERSPICAVVSELPYRGRLCPVAQELFATTLDAYLMLDELLEDESNTSTADGRPASKAAARDRLARAICADREIFDSTDARSASQAVMAAQLERLSAATQIVIARMPSPPQAIVVSGSGEFLALRPIAKLNLQAETVSIARRLEMQVREEPSLARRANMGVQLSRCATAFALAVLAGEQVGRGLQTTSSLTLTRIHRRVIKLGGSLLSNEDWPKRFAAWLARQSAACNLLVVGGGSLADVIRAADETHRLGDDAAHWLAVKAMSIQAEIARTLLPDCAGMIAELAKLQRLAEPGLFVAEPWSLLQQDENARDENDLDGGTLPHSWDVTSDSIAARIAQVWEADELVLLKAGWPQAARDDAEALAEEGYVDRHFPVVVSNVRWRVERIEQ